MARIAFCIDPSVVRGLEYYTGPVFEAELTFESADEDGKPIRFGSVGGGGRYDGLVARFRAEPVPATGFSIGVSRLLAALRAIDSPIVAGAAKPGPVVVAVLDRDHMADYQRLVATLARGGDRRRTVSRRERPQRPAQIRRPARQPVRDHPGLERARRAGRPRRSSSAISGSAPNSPRRARTAPIISNCASAPSSPLPKPKWSRKCARCWRGKRRRGSPPDPMRLPPAQFVYLCFGKSPSLRRELAYSVATLMAELGGDAERIAVFTDRPQDFAGWPQRIVDISDRIAAMRWNGEVDFSFRAKPAALVEALRLFQRDCALLDTDTFVRAGFAARWSRRSPPARR